MQEDGSVSSSILPREDKTMPVKQITIPLFPIVEPWKLSHRAPPGLQRRLENFISHCISQIEPITIRRISNIDKVEGNGHLICSMDMRDKRAELESVCYDRHIVYIQGLPSRTIIACSEPEYTGVMALKTNEVEGMPLSYQIGFFLVKSAIRHYRLIY